MDKPHALTLQQADWDQILSGEPQFRRKQVLHWIDNERVCSLEKMSNLPKKLKEKLDETVRWELPEIVKRFDSADGASRLLIKSDKNQLTETVILRYKDRTSLCVSSQVGCKLACSFCQTGKLGFFRHLPTEEILGQFYQADAIVREEGRKITHVVYMGMGEPLDNFAAVSASVHHLTERIGLSARRVTVSTSGIVPKIGDLAEQNRCSLAVSLHATNDELRSSLMPINKKYPLSALKQSLMDYQKKTGEKITIEYILIKDTNCGKQHANELVHFLHGLKAKINLIPFNSHPGLPYQRPDDESIREFQASLSKRGYPAPVRYSKGLEVSAACGQLAAKHQQPDSEPRRLNVVSR
ncbi:MAG: 23S rRNA (adenine(2503)-C(2))-methyltransferase RlmN [Oligoflexales bacterium]